jgi:transcriptional regulator with XRE-family HTH domain
MNICDRLKEERERLGFDQEGFAALGGASRHSQIDWEKGKSFPNAKVLAAIAAAGADVQYILTGIRSGNVPGAVVLDREETILVDHYRHIADKEDKTAVMKMAMRSAEAATLGKEEPGRKKRA